MQEVFLGFPGRPRELVDNITAGIEHCRRTNKKLTLVPWTELDGSSTPIIQDIVEAIQKADFVVFDITRPNENVFFEIGLASGLGKPVHLILNDAIKNALGKQIDLGLFDTQRLKTYRNGENLSNIIANAQNPYQHTTLGIETNTSLPVFFQNHLRKIEFATSYLACIKEQKLGFRQHDPEEDHRFPLDRLFREISSSSGVFLSLLPDSIVGSEQHNLRTFLMAGVAEANSLPYIILKHGDFVTAFDLRDRVKNAKSRDDVRDAVREIVPQIHECQQRLQLPRRKIAQSHLVSLSLGSSAAENESTQLDSYFLETREYRRAIHAEARLVIGRKGTGKTAIFWQVRNRLRADRSNCVLDLRPESYQLQKLSEVIEEKFSAATYSHTMVLFWEYVLYLELAHKILEDDRQIYARDPRLTESYEELRNQYENVEEFREGDFPERLLQLIGRLTNKARHLHGDETDLLLTQPQISELIYQTNFPHLRDTVLGYVASKKRTIILVDNLDRGWATAGVTESDIRIVQSLIDAGRQIERSAARNKAQLATIIFLRDDVYVWLVERSTDRGKDPVIHIQWHDTRLLQQLIDARLAAASERMQIEPPLAWDDISQGKVGEHSLFDFLCVHCLRRPRALLDLVEASLSNAALASHDRITPEDADRAVSAYSVDMLRDLNYEIRAVYPEADKAIYSFANQSIRLDQRKVERVLAKNVSDKNEASYLVQMLLWFGFFGVIGPDGKETYIFDHGQDIDLLLSHAGASGNPILCLHPLFRRALSATSGVLF